MNCIRFIHSVSSPDKVVGSFLSKTIGISFRLQIMKWHKWNSYTIFIYSVHLWSIRWNYVIQNGSYVRISSALFVWLTFFGAFLSNGAVFELLLAFCSLRLYITSSILNNFAMKCRKMTIIIHIQRIQQIWTAFISLQLLHMQCVLCTAARGSASKWKGKKTRGWGRDVNSAITAAEWATQAEQWMIISLHIVYLLHVLCIVRNKTTFWKHWNRVGHLYSLWYVI